MMATVDSETFVQFMLKFENVLKLLATFRDKPKACFSENVSFLLDKALDHLQKLDCGDAFKASSERCLFLVNIINNSIVRSFILETLDASKALSVQPPVLIFAIKLVEQLGNSEEKFKVLYFHCPAIFPQIERLILIETSRSSDTKHVLLILFVTVAKFQSGRDWLLQTTIPIFAVKSLEDRAIFTRRKAQELVTLILPLLPFERQDEVITRMLNPFGMTEITNVQMANDRLEPCIDVLGKYVETLLPISASESPSGNAIPDGLEDILLSRAKALGNEDLYAKLCSLMVGVYVSRAARDGRSKYWEEETWTAIELCLRRGFVRSTVTIASNGLFYWSHLGSSENFQRQLIFVMLVPILIGIEEIDELSVCYAKYREYWKGVCMNGTCSFVERLKAIISPLPELNELAIISLAGFRRSVHKLDKESGLKIARACMYLLACMKTPTSRRLNENKISPQLTIYLMEAICSYIEGFKIRWWESFETICLPMIITQLIQLNASRNSQVTCSALRALKFCIEQFLHPHQALLLNYSADSTLTDVSDALNLCLVSLHWEVRDSALEVVLVMAQLSLTRYPEFQNLLTRSGLLDAAIAAINDNEPYVRASAVSVIAAAAQAPQLWQHLMLQMNVVERCYGILRQDSEALARRAAAKALTHIVQAEHFPMGSDKSDLYRVMSSASLSDLDWEVKLQALQFWQVIIKETLTKQGMLDGHFPEYTFSQAKQKIVRLDAKEIRSRLELSLADLSSRGCLHILLQLVDDCDAPVKEKAIRLLLDLREILAAYNALDLTICRVTEARPPVTEPASSAADNRVRMDEDAVDRIIEGILDTNDSALVAGIVSAGPSSGQEIKVDPDVPVRHLDPNDFMAQMNAFELETMLQWTSVTSDLHLTDLDSLFDDLKDCIHTDDSRPTPDCY